MKMISCFVFRNYVHYVVGAPRCYSAVQFILDLSSRYDRRGYSLHVSNIMNSTQRFLRLWVIDGKREN